MKDALALVVGISLLSAAACSEMPASMTAPSPITGAVASIPGSTAIPGAITVLGGAASAQGDAVTGLRGRADQKTGAVGRRARCKALGVRLKAAVQAGRITAEAARKRHAARCKGNARKPGAESRSAECKALGAQLKAAVRTGRITAEAARERYAGRCPRGDNPRHRRGRGEK